ncbi:MAG TPA: hypothetical protein VFN67_21040 [Polyangiales bacterium]|nr:hypothetical protein [Polyangiales bacterium]
MVEMAHVATEALYAARSMPEMRCILAMKTDLRSAGIDRVRARCVRRSLSVGDLHCAQEAGKEAVNVSCSIRDSGALFDLALDPGGFSGVNGETPRALMTVRATPFFPRVHTVLETFLQLLAVAHARLEPAYSE